MSTPGAVPAASGRRLLAAVVDTLAAFVLGGGFVVAGFAVQVAAVDDGSLSPTGVSPLTVLGIALLVTFLAVQWWYQGTRGFTLGSRLVGVRTLAARTGRPVGMGRIALRMLVLTLALAVPVLGPVLLLVSALRDPAGRRQGWHDKAAGTVVFDIGVGIDPATLQVGETGRRMDRLLAPTVSSTLDVPHAEPADEVDQSAELDTGPRQPTTPVRVPVLVAPRADGIGSEHPGAPLVNGASPSVDSGQPSELTDPRRPARPAEAPSAGLPERVVPVGAYESVSFGSLPLDEEVDRTRLRSARSKVAYAPSRGARPRATLLLWDNRLIVLDGTALVGRNPAPRAGEQLPVQVIAVVDRGRSVSKTHLAIGVDRDGVWLRDRNSTNGTIVTLADGQQILCAPEQTVRVPSGASVAFGDYWLTVTG